VEALSKSKSRLGDQITFDLDKEQKLEVRRYAAKRNLPMAEVCRMALTWLLENDNL
jgi:hypothetical protein